MLCSRKKMSSSCLRMNHESDEDMDLEVLRVAALKSRKPRYPRVNHSNLIPIVPVNVETEFVQRKVSPTRETNVLDDNKIKDSRTKEDEKASNHSGSIVENDADILSMDDKEEEDSLEKLMDQLEAEISGKAPIPCSKKLTNSKQKNTQNDNDSEVNSGKHSKAAIENRGSPELKSKQMPRKNSVSPKRSRGRRSGSRFRSRSRSFYSGGRSYRRSKSPYWSRSPQRSKSPFRRSRSPYWSFRRTRSKSRSPVRRYRSPGRKRSPFSRLSRSRSRSYGRRRSPWSSSPRRSKSPFYRDCIHSPRRRNFNSPGRPRSYTPKDSSKSPRRRSRSPRRVPRDSPYRRSKSPYRSTSPYRRTPLRRSKSPNDKLNSPNRSPLGKRHSNSPIYKSTERTSSKPRSPLRRLGRPKGGRSSKSPVPFRNRSPLKVVEKNKLDEKMDKSRDRDRLGRRHRSLSRENNRAHDRRTYRRGGFFPSRKRSTKSPKQKRSPDKNRIESKPEKEESPVPSAPVDPVLEARKKKFETLGEVDPTIDKKINLKAIKESTENAEKDEDALTINVENNLWEESEESEDECESRFKSNGAKKNCITNPRSVLSFRNLRENDAKKRALNIPLTDENRRDNNPRRDSWLGRKNDSEKRRGPFSRGRSEDGDPSKSKFKSEKAPDDDGKKSNRKPIVWYSRNERKFRPGSKDNEKSATRIVISDSKNKSCERIFNESGKGNKNSELLETDDFDKLISDFEKELESDICLSSNELKAVASQEENKKSRISVKRDLVEPKMPTTQSTTKPPRIVRIRDASLTKVEKDLDAKSVTKAAEVKEKVIQDEPKEIQDGPEDYIEDDDFVLEVSATRQKKDKEEAEEDKQSDLRAVLSKRRNERLIKVVSLPENMPARLILSAFQGLGHKKLQKADNEEGHDLELPSVEKNVKNSGVESRRVLLLHKDKNPLKSLKYTVPEAKPDTTIHQRLPWSKDRRKRKLLRQQDPSEEMDQEEEEERFEVEEEKHFPRFRLKRKITISSQPLMPAPPPEGLLT